MISSRTFEDTVLLTGIKRGPFFVLVVLAAPLCNALTCYYLSQMPFLNMQLQQHLLAWSSLLLLIVIGPGPALGPRFQAPLMRQLFEIFLVSARYFIILAGINWLAGDKWMLSTVNILYWATLAIPGAQLIYYVAMKCLLSPRFREPPIKVLMVGITPLSVDWARRISTNAFYSVNVVGFLDSRSKSREGDMSSISKLGRIEDLSEICAKHRVDRVMIGLPSSAHERIDFVMKQVKDTTISVYILQGKDGFEPLGMRFETVIGLSSVSIIESPAVTRAWLAKSIFDRVTALFLVTIFSPLLIFLAIAIRLDSPGPALFRQSRYGVGGKPFSVFKFRTMNQVSSASTGTGVEQAKKHDARVTGIGGFLRKTSLDELPQLFNVVGGTMSLVGPRPHANSHNEMYRSMISGYMLRHTIKPGMTGLAQIRGHRGATETVDKMEARILSDLDYIREWSLWLDICILFKTPISLISNKNVF